VGLVGQIQNLIGAVQNYINGLPAFIASLSHKVVMLGPFRLDFSTFDWSIVGQQILSTSSQHLAPGGLVGTLAGGAATTLGWTVFVVVVSFFLPVGKWWDAPCILHFDIRAIPGIIQRSPASRTIWNAFLRGQVNFLSRNEISGCRRYATTNAINTGAMMA